MTTGEQFAGYRILFPCGHGAFGEVFLAEDMLGHRVALKVFSGAQAGEAELKALRRYMQLPPHPAICHIYQCGMENDRLFYTMEAADNALGPDATTYEPDTLARRMAGRKQFPIDEALAYCEQLVDALEVLHSAGLTHRDIKPENIIFVQGQLKIADFGLLADISQTLSLAGTLGFLPPELLEGKHVKGPLCDIYAVGKILYCTVTGKEPLEYPALPNNLPADTLRRLCIPAAKLCAKNPAARCGTCRECRELLEEAAKGKAGFWRGTVSCLRMIPALGRGVALVILAVLILGCAGGWGLSAYLRKREARHILAVKAAQNALQEFRQSTAKLPLQCPDFDLKAVTDELERLFLAEDFEEFHANLGIQESLLQSKAESAIPTLPQAGTPMERYRALAKFYSYLDSPLTAFLPQEKLQSLRKQADDYSAALTPDKQCPRQGQNFHPMGWTGPETWNYVPPQTFFSTTRNQPQKIDYPFWVMDRKLTNEFYLYLTKDVRNERLPANNAVTNLDWDDMLNVCRLYNRSLQSHGGLPPGYGIRLPTEAEWELLSQGGWSSQENPFQLHDKVLDKPFEVVLPYPETLELERQKDILVVRGCNGNGTVSLTGHRLMYKDTWFVDFVTFRPVIAPMDEDFYEMQWFKSAVWREAIVNGKHYCGRANCISRQEYQDVQELAGLLRARPVEPASPEELRSITDALKMIEYYPFFIGASYQNGAWRFHSSGMELDWEGLPVPLEKDSQKRVLSGRGQGNFTAMIVHDEVQGHGLPAIVLEWATEEDYQHRLDCWKDIDTNPLLTSVEVAGRKYALLHLNCSGLETIALAQLFGTKLAMLKDEAALQELQDNFKDTNEVIQLGAHRGYNWAMFWDDGTTTALPEFIPNRTGRMSGSSVVLDGLAVYHGQLVGSDAGTALLLEIPENHLGSLEK